MWSSRWRKAEGQLCRNDTDCSWLNKDLKVSKRFKIGEVLFLFQCFNYSLGFTPAAEWFDGDSASIIGQVQISNILSSNNISV